MKRSLDIVLISTIVVLDNSQVFKYMAMLATRFKEILCKEEELLYATVNCHTCTETKCYVCFEVTDSTLLPRSASSRFLPTMNTRKKNI